MPDNPPAPPPPRRPGFSRGEVSSPDSLPALSPPPTSGSNEVLRADPRVCVRVRPRFDESRLRVVGRESGESGRFTCCAWCRGPKQARSEPVVGGRWRSLVVQAVPLPNYKPARRRPPQRAAHRVVVRGVRQLHRLRPLVANRRRRAHRRRTQRRGRRAPQAVEVVAALLVVRERGVPHRRRRGLRRARARGAAVGAALAQAEAGPRRRAEVDRRAALPRHRSDEQPLHSGGLLVLHRVERVEARRLPRPLHRDLRHRVACGKGGVQDQVVGTLGGARTG